MNAQTTLTGLLTALLTTACLPTLALKTPSEFTDPQVKRMQFADTCNLQRYFDRKPPRILTLSERAMSPDGRTEVGRARLLVRRGPQLTKLGEVLKRHYREVPAWLLSADVTVRTDFLRRIPRAAKTTRSTSQKPSVRLIPVTAYVTMDVGKRRIEVAYHPCLGELLFGRRTYQLRRKLLGNVSPPHRRAMARPTPRPMTRPVTRPVTRPRSRPRTRPTLRPAPRPAPRPEPRRRGLPPLPR